ncbi:MAG TPA: fumarate hydratase [Candidatus Korarchaeota archaeon]|nr:fumarate hydratase [Candidatus Korarchaeota archaeon]
MAEYRLKTPIPEEEARKLRVGDVIYLSGTIVTARDAAHRRVLETLDKGEELPISLKGLAIYHCGPVIKKVGEEWRIFGGGPTTSTRMEIFEAEFIQKTGIRAVIGKGGMGDRTADAMRRFGAFYATFPGGASVLAIKSVKRVKDVFWLDLGMPEAMWVLEVEDFGPLLVAIDSCGNNLHEKIVMQASEKLKGILKEI